MQGQTREIKLPEQKLNRNLLTPLNGVKHKRWVRVLGWIGVFIFTVVMGVSSILIWRFIATTPMCVQNGSCAPHYQPAPFPPNPTDQNVKAWIKGPH